jgi:uncharacterized protein YjiK
MKKLNIVYMLVAAMFVMLSGFSCTGQTYKSPQGYDLTKPVKYNMPESLLEISGIAFHHGKSDSLYAEQDEEGHVYYFRLGDKQVSHSKFGKRGDYEDIAILNDQVILLRSDGTLFIFPYNQVRNKDIANVQTVTNVLPPGEYEGLYADEKANQFYVLCKHCSVDNTKKSSSGYIFNLSANGGVKQSGTFSINVKDIEAIIAKKKVAFHPSALAKNPLTNEWYILSSVNKLLVVTDAAWKVKAAYTISPSLFIQPEGIAFDNQNNLYISNEGDKITPGTVLKFNYKKQAYVP